MQQVLTGLDVLAGEGFQRLQGQRIGLVAHPASVDNRLCHAADMLQNAPRVKLECLFGPEHGWAGHAQDLEPLRSGGTHNRSPRVISLYGDTAASLRPSSDQLEDLDTLVIDLQDIGARYYTFQATMLYCLEAANAVGLRVLVLDRPNPLGGLGIEGPSLRTGYESFVGAHDVATRHGLTIGELARLYQAERKMDNLDLEVVPCRGWARGLWFDQTGLPWVLPSPNMPTLETAVVYPGQCLLEGTNLSEGRGTTRPFELCGAPWLNPEVVARELNQENLPGVAFRPTRFQPTFQKHAGKLCGGVQLHVLDRGAFQPVRTGLAVLAQMRRLSGENFRWRSEPYEFVADPPAIDLLFGSDRERRGLEAGRSWRELAEAWVSEEQGFAKRRRSFLLY
ncbi:MAG TPA: DUF1343 domain-containing protein [Verrucomicrobiae bacterium]|nr:DUF1343 domain-containing protein [Verrucomicrobiae bacterium]